MAKLAFLFSVRSLTFLCKITGNSALKASRNIICLENYGKGKKLLFLSICLSEFAPRFKMPVEEETLNTAV